MEAHGDLIKVSDLTDWILPYVNVKKKDKVKITMNHVQTESTCQTGRLLYAYLRGYLAQKKLC